MRAKCRNFPSLAASPPQISRSDLAPPSWQNSMATNCPQLLKPRACRSALCLRAAVSNPVRETSCNICEKMLHTLFKAESSSDSLVFANSYQRLSAFFFPKAIRSAELIWTRMIRNLFSVLFNHAIRYEWLEQGRNPITLVRQSAKRKSTPEVLDPHEIQGLLLQLDSCFRLMVMLDVTTGLRRSELFALKLLDVD